jgi:hypothetical protein
MKSDAVDSWIGHWLKIQKKNKRPLVLKNRSDSTSDKRANPITVPRRRRNKRKDRYIDSDDTDDEAAANDETTDEADDDGSNGDEHGTRPNGAGKSGKGVATAKDVQGTRHNGADKRRKASATAKGNPIIVSRRKRNKGKGRYIERDDSEDEASPNNETADEANNGGSIVDGHGTHPNGAGKSGKGASTARDTQGTRHDHVEEGGEDRATARNADGARSDSANKVNDGGTNTNGLPPSPSSAATNRQSRRDFLRSLSDDHNYQKLLLLLRAAEVCNSIFSCALSKPFPEGRPVQGNATSMGNVEVR